MAGTVTVLCKNCKVARGYRPILDYVELCTLHSAASSLLNALVKTAKLAHKNTKSHSYWLSFKECDHTTCKAASEAIESAATKGEKS